ncbi:hypothetical protein SANTM175S_00985 [Streptomyces antimycoticus]
MAARYGFECARSRSAARGGGPGRPRTRKRVSGESHAHRAVVVPSCVKRGFPLEVHLLPGAQCAEAGRPDVGEVTEAATRSLGRVEHAPAFLIALLWTVVRTMGEPYRTDRGGRRTGVRSSWPHGHSSASRTRSAICTRFSTASLANRLLVWALTVATLMVSRWATSGWPKSVLDGPSGLAFSFGQCGQLFPRRFADEWRAWADCGPVAAAITRAVAAGDTARGCRPRRSAPRRGSAAVGCPRGSECSGATGAEHEVVGVEGGQHEHPWRRAPGEEFPGRAETVTAGHPHVHQHDVRPLLVHHGNRGVPVGRLRDDGRVRFAVDDQPQRHAHQLFVVDPYGHSPAPSRRPSGFSSGGGLAKVVVR